MNKKQIFLIIGIIFISFNLISPLTSVGPLIGLIRDDIGISNGLSGFLTTLPLITFAVFSPFIIKISEKLGNGLTILLGITLIIIGEFVRSYTGIPGLFIGTTIIGMGIAIGNVLIPAIIKLKFPDRIGFVTSLYSPCMCIIGGLASGFSIPIATGLGFGWKNALATWSIVGFITMIIWLPQVKRRSQVVSEIAITSENIVIENNPNNKLWKSLLAWQVTIFMGLQSILFYSIMTWLPTILSTYNIDIKTAGFMSLFFQIISVPASFIASQMAGKLKEQKYLVTFTSFIYLLGCFGLSIGGSTTLLYVSLTFIGIGSGSSVSLALSFMGLRTSNAREAAKLSAMSQSIGYLFAAIGPFLIGTIYDYTNSFAIPLIILMIAATILMIVGYLSGRNKYVFE